MFSNKKVCDIKMLWKKEPDSTVNTLKCLE